MPKGIYPRTEYHKKITSDGAKKAYERGIKKCHRLFHKIYGRIKIGKEQIDEFIKNNEET